jgi:hypothetical protein
MRYAVEVKRLAIVAALLFSALFFSNAEGTAGDLAATFHKVEIMP